MKQITPVQKKVISYLRLGWEAYNCLTNNKSAYLERYSFRDPIRITVFNRLIDMGLLSRAKKNFAIDQFKLTELGKTIEL